MRKTLYYLLLLIALSGCNRIENAIINKTKNECDPNVAKECVLNLNDVTGFKWDKLYLFEDWTTSDSISSTLGINYVGNDVTDDYTRMLFMLKIK